VGGILFSTYQPSARRKGTTACNNGKIFKLLQAQSE
jgi:hypothetical protein